MSNISTLRFVTLDLWWFLAIPGADQHVIWVITLQPDIPSLETMVGQLATSMVFTLVLFFRSREDYQGSNFFWLEKLCLEIRCLLEIAPPRLAESLGTTRQVPITLWCAPKIGFIITAASSRYIGFVNNCNKKEFDIDWSSFHAALDVVTNTLLTACYS